MTYNLTLVLKSSLKDGDRKKILDSVKDLFGKAKITEKEWGQKPLAYSIKKESSGFYVNMNIESDEVVSKEAEKKIFNNADILRHLLLRV